VLIPDRTEETGSGKEEGSAELTEEQLDKEEGGRSVGEGLLTAEVMPPCEEDSLRSEEGAQVNHSSLPEPLTQ